MCVEKSLMYVIYKQGSDNPSKRNRSQYLLNDFAAVAAAGSEAVSMLAESDGLVLYELL